jgi:hypothetical protein
MFSIFDNGANHSEAPLPTPWARLLRYTMVLAFTAVLFGSLYFGVQFFE